MTILAPNSQLLIHFRRQVTPINTMLLKIESTPICHKSYPDCVKEKYSAGMRQRQEKISQQEETYVRFVVKMSYKFTVFIL